MRVAVLKKAYCKMIAIGLLSFAVSGLMGGQAFAADKLKFQQYRYSSTMKLRGFEISPGVLFGQAKVAGQYGLGFVINKKTFAWGINNRGMAIERRF